MFFIVVGNALSCKETFSLLYYEFDAATREPPPWDAERYKLIGKVKICVNCFFSTPVTKMAFIVMSSALN